MKTQSADTSTMPGWMHVWERFWFTPQDPILLGAIRIMCGMIVLYTFATYSLMLQDMMGKEGWVSLELRESLARERPVLVGPLSGQPPPVTAPRTPAEEAYFQKYKFDSRIFGLKSPETPAQMAYLERYTQMWRQPPPAYATSPEEENEINDYMKREGIDPRLLYSRGSPIWSVWLHVTDPAGMAVVQAVFVLVAFLFVIGLGTRVTAALTWFASLCYIHRNAQVVFGVDTMMNILLLYLAIGPSGAALSVDRLIARWWRGWANPLPPPAPSVSANVAVRLLQIHICIIYLVAGLAKLQGPAWWTGTALWNVLANYEFAPMQFAVYNDILRWLCRNQLRIELVLTAGCYFTLFFEISYSFLVWWPRTRWVMLGAALLLHGTIGMFMGLKTFSLVMLVMNMGFLRPSEIHWVLNCLKPGGSPRKPVSPPSKLESVRS